MPIIRVYKTKYTPILGYTYIIPIIIYYIVCISHVHVELPVICMIYIISYTMYDLYIFMLCPNTEK